METIRKVIDKILTNMLAKIDSHNDIGVDTLKEILLDLREEYPSETYDSIMLYLINLSESDSVDAAEKHDMLEKNLSFIMSEAVVQ